MEVVEKLSKKIEAFGKVYIKEQKDISPFGFMVEKVAPQVDVITHTIATMPVSYDIKDYDGEKGQTALNFVKTTVKTAIEKEDETLGIATTVHTDLINNLATDDNETERLASTIVNSLYKGQVASRTKKIMDALKKITKVKTVTSLGFQGLYDIIKNPKNYINAPNDMFPTIYNQSDIVIIVKASKIDNIQYLRNNTQEVWAVNRDLPQVIVMPDEYFTEPKVYGYIISKDALKVYEKYITIEPQNNAKYGFTNYFLRTKNTYFLSPFELAVKISEN